MTIKRIIGIATALIFSVLSLTAQNTQPASSTYNQALIALKNNDNQRAMDLFMQELTQNRSNGYAHMHIAQIRNQMQQYGPAISSATTALKNIPSSDVKNMANTHNILASSLLSIGDTAKALAQTETSLQLQPDNTEALERHAHILYKMGKYDQSSADYEKIKEIDPKNIVGYLGVGRNLNAQGQWYKAIKQFNLAINLYSSSSVARIYRAQSYVGLKNWSEALNNIEEANDVYGYDILSRIDNFSLETEDIKKQLYAIKETYPIARRFYELRIRDEESDVSGLENVAITLYKYNDFEGALTYLNTLCQINEPNSWRYANIRVNCYEEMYEYDKALEIINSEINKYPNYNNIGMKCRKANNLLYHGRFEESAALWDTVLSSNEFYTSSLGYVSMAMTKHALGKKDEALQNYSYAVASSFTNSDIFAQRGNYYAYLGRTNEAKRDYERVIELESDTSLYKFCFYAYRGLGNEAKALETLNLVINRDTTNRNSYYEAACFYASMNRPKEALQNLEHALRLGFRNFVKIDIDFLFDNIRNTPEFKNLVEKYKGDKSNTINGVATAQTANNNEAAESKVIEVPFTKENGVCKVTCSVNGLPLYFIFDTGAGIVSLSKTEAFFMLNNGYLSESDITGSSVMTDATGESSVATEINIKKVNFGGLEIENIRAIIVPNQKAPLLLGQSVINRLGKVEIDYKRNVLRITKTSL